MFGFGDENKDKLEENMDEIKSMIENGESLQQTQPGAQEGNQQMSQQEPSQELPDMSEQSSASEQDSLPKQDSQMSSEDVDSFEKELEEQFGNEGPEQQHNQSQSPDTQGSKQPQRSDHSQMQKKTNSSPAQRGREASHEETNVTSDAVSRGDKNNVAADRHSGRSQRRSVDTEIPEPAKTRELNVPEIDKGPLFIRRQKFEHASQLIQEMRYLADQVEKTVNDVEADIQRDQETESQIREILHEFEDDRTEVERIVSPDKE